MNTDLFQTTFWEIIRSFLCGIGICFIYLFLSWKTALLYVKYKKGIIMLISFIVRLFLVIALFKLCLFGKVSNLFYVVIGFCLTRLIVLKNTQKARISNG